MASEGAGSALENFTRFSVPANEDKLKDVAREELGETDELKKECLQQLKTLIKDHNIAYVTSDDFLLRFLRTKKFNVERSFKSFKNYAKQRVALHKRFVQLQPEKLKELVRRNIYTFLPYRDSEERVIFFCKQGFWNQEVFSEEDMLMTMLLILSYASEKMSSQVTGLVCLFDPTSLPVSHIPFIIRNARTATEFCVDSLPLRYYKIHFINEHFLLKYLLRILNPLFPKKIQGKAMFHGQSREDLFRHISPSILPDAFGGSLGPMTSEFLIEEIVDYLQWMKDERFYFIGYDMRQN